MRITSTRHKPRSGTRTLTTMSRQDDRLYVREWELTAPAVAEEILEVEVSRVVYQRVAAAYGGEETLVQRVDKHTGQ